MSKLLRNAALVVIASVGIYAFSPALQNLFGSVKPPTERPELPAEIAAKTLKGASWSLSDQKGKVVLVNFWATWCPPCRMETPALVDLHRKYESQGFTVAGVNMDDDQRDVPGFIQRYSIPYPVLVPARNFPLLEKVEALPTTVLIDRSGRVARIYRGMVTERGLKEEIETLLAEKPGA